MGDGDVDEDIDVVDDELDEGDVVVGLEDVLLHGELGAD